MVVFFFFLFLFFFFLSHVPNPWVGRRLHDPVNIAWETRAFSETLPCEKRREGWRYTYVYQICREQASQGGRTLGRFTGTSDEERKCGEELTKCGDEPARLSTRNHG